MPGQPPGAGLPGWRFDSATGYYLNPSTGVYFDPQRGAYGVDGRWIGPQPGEHADEWVARLRPLLYQQFLLDVEARVVAVDLEPFPARV